MRGIFKESAEEMKTGELSHGNVNRMLEDLKH